MFCESLLFLWSFLARTRISLNVVWFKDAFCMGLLRTSHGLIKKKKTKNGKEVRKKARNGKETRPMNLCLIKLGGG